MVGDDLDLDRAIELLNDVYLDLSVTLTPENWNKLHQARDLIAGVRNKMRENRQALVPCARCLKEFKYYIGQEDPLFCKECCGH